MRLMIIEPIDPSQATDLINELDEYQAGLYPAESNHLESEDQLRESNVRMYGCFYDNDLIAIGAVKFMSGYGEIKRVYVPHQHRGKGIAKKMMTTLESLIREQGMTYARLETGIHQHEAIGLYERIGYVKRDPFGDYARDPLSVFMEKAL